MELLIERYSNPMNFTLSDEASVREVVLEGLMLRDRRRVEEDSLAFADNDALWYRLSLVAIHSGVTHDLRFLDALNYFFELIPDNWRPRSRHNWLFVAYLALYARALAAKCDDFKCE